MVKYFTLGLLWIAFNQGTMAYLTGKVSNWKVLLLGLPLMMVLWPLGAMATCLALVAPQHAERIIASLMAVLHRAALAWRWILSTLGLTTLVRLWDEGR